MGRHILSERVWKALTAMERREANSMAILMARSVVMLVRTKRGIPL